MATATAEDPENAEDEAGEVVFKTSELAAFLRISSSTVWRMKALGIGPPYIEVGGSIRYLKSEAIAWLKSKQVTPVG